MISVAIFGFSLFNFFMCLASYIFFLFPYSLRWFEMWLSCVMDWSEWVRLRMAEVAAESERIEDELGEAVAAM